MFYSGSSRAASRREASRWRIAVAESLEHRTLLSTDVLTWHYDPTRIGANQAETALNSANVTASTFGKLTSFPVDGYVYAQPLIRTGVNVPGFGVRDLLLVATEHDTVYAFDANGNNPPIGYLWKHSFLSGPAGTTVTTVPNGDVGTGDIVPEIGITGTPAIDPVTNTLYVVVKTKETTSGITRYVQRLHALDLSTGNEKLGGPVEITATVPGTGDGGSTVTFNALRENQRCALLLADGNVYIAWASHGDNPPYHGWVIAYNASNIQQQTAVWTATPNGTAGGIWMSGGGISTDSAGNLYVAIGNGTFDANTGGKDYGDSLVKLSPNLAVLGYFTPKNQSTLSSQDLDFGVSVAMVLPDQSGPTSHELLVSDKTGRLYLLNRDNLGGFNSVVNNDVSEITPGHITLHNNVSYWNGRVYVGADGAPLTAYPIVNGVFGPAQSVSPEVFGTYDANGNGSSPTVSSNGNAAGIVWISDNSGYGSSSPAIIHAYDATDLSTELWNSSQAASSRDRAAAAVKFTSPVVANGFVYLGGQNAVTMYGLLTTTPPPPPPPTGSTVQVPLSGAYNQIGIYADGATFASSGGLDRSGSALSGTLLGTSATWGGSSFALGPAGANDVVHGGTGVLVSLPAGQYSSLQLLATAVNGNISSSTFTVAYTDGTTQSFNQGISDWFTPQSYSGESTAITMPYRDTYRGARDTRTFNVYGYTFALNPAKTVRSVTLPTSNNVMVLAADLTGTSTVTTVPAVPTGVAAAPAGSSQINVSWAAVAGASSYDLYRSSTPGGEGTVPYRAGITTNSFADTGLPATSTYYYTVVARNSLGASAPSIEVSATTSAPSAVVPVSLASSFNRIGIYADGATFPNAGGLDRSGNALSAALLGSSVLWNGKTYTIGTANANNVVAGGATITLPAGSYSSLSLLATATNGNQPGQTFTVHYTDGTSQTFTQGISDWYTPQNYAGETKALTMSYRNMFTGGRDTRVFQVYGYTFALNPAKTVQSLTLPPNANVEVLAIDLA